jgi:hypothetical protein
MARQTINIGTTANDGTGDPLRTAFDKINDNFVELYGADNDSKTLAGNLDVNGWNIISTRSNEDIRILPAGTGRVIAGALTFSGTEISSEDSTQVTIKENVAVTGTLGVSGATTLSTSLTLASGATVTAILDDDTMATASNTTLATSESIKAYIDNQNTIQDLDFTADDSTTNSIDLDSEVLQFSGGTGLTSSANNNTVTYSIDSTVATLTGSQTLTNKTLTSPIMTGTVEFQGTINADTIVSNSNGNITINPGGTGTIEAEANTNVTGTLTSSGALTVSSGGANITGTLVTDDVTTQGNQTVTGNTTVSGSVFTDTISSYASNQNLAISASGTGVVDVTSAMTTIGQTVTGTVSITGQLNADNLRIDGNTISSTSGGITLDAGGQNIQSNSTIVAGEINTTLLEATTVRTDKLQNDISNGDIQIDTQGTGVVDFRTATQTTVGAAGGADALPATPTGYLEVKISGTAYVIPYYAKS